MYAHKEARFVYSAHHCEIIVTWGGGLTWEEKICSLIFPEDAQEHTM